jgi:heme-degrading monooxygenase HmoA
VAVAGLIIIRPIHPLPGRHQEALRWLAETENVRRQAGQISQFVLRSVVDSSDFEFIQVWQDRGAYDRWRESPERSRLANERQNFLTHDPTRLFDVIA